MRAIAPIAAAIIAVFAFAACSPPEDRPTAEAAPEAAVDSAAAVPTGPTQEADPLPGNAAPTPVPEASPPGETPPALPTEPVPVSPVTSPPPK